MLPELEMISRMRKELGLTQIELAKQSGVSQSMIAKIERKRMNPSYESVRRILGALNAELNRRKKRTRAEEVCSRRVVIVDSEERVSEAAEKMQKYGYSQLPIFSGERQVGSITDKTINNWLLQGRDPRKLSVIRVKEVMEPPFPQIDGGAPIELVANLLEHYQAVLVALEGKTSGIITKSDLMKLL